jgi:hypothetical protein
MCPAANRASWGVFCSIDGRTLDNMKIPDWCSLEDAGTPVITPEEITMFVMEQTSYAAKRRRSNWTGNYADVLPRLLEREILDYNTRLMDRFVVKKEDAE